jgi:hypothetical protein
MATLFVLAPSFFAQIINGILILIFLYLFLSNYKDFMKLNYLQKLQVIGTLSIAFGVHGTLHLGLEQAYDYNPIIAFFT